MFYVARKVALVPVKSNILSRNFYVSGLISGVCPLRKIFSRDFSEFFVRHLLLKFALHSDATPLHKINEKKPASPSTETANFFATFNLYSPRLYTRNLWYLCCQKYPKYWQVQDFFGIHHHNSLNLSRKCSPTSLTEEITLVVASANCSSYNSIKKSCPMTCSEDAVQLTHIFTILGHIKIQLVYD